MKMRTGASTGLSVEAGSRLQCLCPFFNIPFEIDDLMLIVPVHETGCNHEVRSGLVDRHGNVVNLCNTHQGFYIRIVRLCCQRIGKEYDKVNYAFHDLGSDLLVTTKRAAVVAFTVSPVWSVIMRAVVPVP